jgi:hypothetical protein
MCKKIKLFLRKNQWFGQFFLLVIFSVGLLLPPSMAVASSPAEPPFESQLRGCFEDKKPSNVIQSEQVWKSNLPSVFRSWTEAAAFAQFCRRRVCGSQNNLCCNTFCSMAGWGDPQCISSCLN